MHGTCDETPPPLRPGLQEMVVQVSLSPLPQQTALGSPISIREQAPFTHHQKGLEALRSEDGRTVVYNTLLTVLGLEVQGVDAQLPPRAHLICNPDTPADCLRWSGRKDDVQYNTPSEGQAFLACASSPSICCRIEGNGKRSVLSHVPPVASIPEGHGSKVEWSSSRFLTVLPAVHTRRGEVRRPVCHRDVSDETLPSSRGFNHVLLSFQPTRVL
ncbi:hypothetical protein NDU88_003562 [Pleurodeles waltl]|uniref:Uncharacterized protein n=1 Tax=Pleurodeles waltl TaxID=8319 RepID=A0AAV7NLT7_PLEWA|nr:hypothetical protein NDU88_003562 [Pleurodeles waltl]